MHAGIVNQGGFVDIDIKTVGGLHLERGLNSCIREWML